MQIKVQNKDMRSVFSFPPPLTKSNDNMRVGIDLMKRLSSPALPVVVWLPEGNYLLVIRNISYAQEVGRIQKSCLYVCRFSNCNIIVYVLVYIIIIILLLF